MIAKLNMSIVHCSSHMIAPCSIRMITKSLICLLLLVVVVVEVVVVVVVVVVIFRLHVKSYFKKIRKK